MATSLWRVAILGDKTPIAPVLAVDKLFSQIDGGNVLLKFEGFAPGTEPAEKIVPLLYFRSVFAHWPGRIFIGDERMAIRFGNEFLGAKLQTDQAWIEHNKISNSVAFIRSPEGVISTEVESFPQKMRREEAAGKLPYLVRLIAACTAILLAICLSRWLIKISADLHLEGRKAMRDALSIASLLAIAISFALVAADSLMMPLYEWDSFAI